MCRWAKREALGKKLYLENFQRVQNFLLGYCESKSLIAKPKIELRDAPHNIMIENNENMCPQQQALMSLCVLFEGELSTQLSGDKGTLCGR